MHTSERGAGGFAIEVPRLRDWTQQQMADSAPGFVLHRFELPADGTGEMGSATITVAAFSPADTTDAAYANLDVLRPTGEGWKQTLHESVEVCGVRGVRVSGTTDLGGLGMRQDYLELAYDLNGKVYPIQITSQVKLPDPQGFTADVETILNGVRMLP
ncbi:hypothetical protein ACWIGI_17800 [Nocardia sp. NPDC055321]